MQKVSVNTALMKNAMSAVKQILSNKKNVGFCTLECTDGRLYIRTTDFEYYLSMAIPVGQEVQVPAYAVNGNKLADMFLTMNGDISTITFDDRGISISDGKNKFKLASVSKEQIEFPSLSNCRTIHVPVSILKDTITIVEHAVAKSMYNFSGISLRFQDETFEVASTDTYRMSTATIRYAVGDTAQFIIPPRLAKILSKLNISDNTAIQFDDAMHFIVINDSGSEWSLYVRLIEGEFPDSQDTINSFNFHCRVELPRSELSDAIKSLSIVSEEAVDINVEESVFKLHSKSEDCEADRDVTFTSIECDRQANLSIKIKYLADAVSVLDDQNPVRILIDDSAKALLIEQSNDNIAVREVIMGLV